MHSFGWFDEHFLKTVYDNTIISDDLMRQWAKEALSNGSQMTIVNQRSAGQAPIVSIKISGYALNGLKFEAWLDESTRMIKSYYPVID